MSAVVKSTFDARSLHGRDDEKTMHKKTKRHERVRTLREVCAFTCGDATSSRTAAAERWGSGRKGARRSRTGGSCDVMIET